MDRNTYRALALENPKFKCLKCQRLEEAGCNLKMTPDYCGRDNFRPKDGGSNLFYPDPPIKPKNKDGVELEIPKTEEKVNAT